MNHCADCIHYEKDAVTVGNRLRSACKREGAKETAMTERFNGECGLDGKHWEDARPS